MSDITKLSKTQSARFLSLAGIMLLLCISTIAYAAEFKNISGMVEYADDVNVDGVDFTPVANLFVMGTNGLIQLITFAGICMFLIIISLILLIPWRPISIRKSSLIDEAEPRLCKKAFVIFVVITATGAIIAAGTDCLLAVIPMVLIPSVPVLLLAVLSVVHAYEKQSS